MLTQARADATPPGGDFSESAAAAAWELTRTIAVRPTVRLATADAYGAVQNDYSRTWRTSWRVPDQPWALNLTDREGRFHFLGFDLDRSRGDAAADAARLAFLLDDHGIAHLTTRSGPSDGRHVWVGLSSPLPASAVRHLAGLLAQLLPTLDRSPLTNPGAGALRPPLSPHRHGGTSRILAGWASVLTAPSTEPEAIARLGRALLAELGELTPAPRPQPAFRRTPLTASTEALLEHGAPERRDRSAVLAAALARLHAAGEPFSRAVQLARHSPAFAHVRTDADGRPRPPDAQSAILRRQWTRVGQWVEADSARRPGGDPAFPARLADVVARVDAVQQRANASPGRWIYRGHASGRPTDRLVLDALCLTALHAARSDVEAPIRAIALLAGVGRETARTALQRLAEDGWIVLDQAGEGVRGTRWALSTATSEQIRSQVVPPPADPPAARTALTLELSSRLELTRHDTFAAPGSLGRTAGTIYAALPSDQPASVAEISLQTGIPAHTIRKHLTRLHALNLGEPSPAGSRRRPAAARDDAAAALGVAGYLEAREIRYREEQQLWAWWTHELERRHTRRQPRRRRAGSPGLFATSSDPPFPIHPTRAGTTRADFSAARAALRSGALERPEDVFDLEQAA